ncbi:hypothetical protein [Streptomyces sp. STR69]|uniref:hypothetical protein n=1 Tax=Streptomyces sp. STR69 TaxID=1796942 RepID=UPI0021C57D36|nr:hypothetical protein [Streptomyces sp. STR69]
MRTLLTTLVGALSAAALVLGVGATVGSGAPGPHHTAHHVVADNQGPTSVTS